MVAASWFGFFILLYTLRSSAHVSTRAVPAWTGLKGWIKRREAEMMLLALLIHADTDVPPNTSRRPFQCHIVRRNCQQR